MVLGVVELETTVLVAVVLCSGGVVVVSTEIIHYIIGA